MLVWGEALLRLESGAAPDPETWQAVHYWLRRNLRAALWVLAVGLVLGVLVGCAAYMRILQYPLAETVDASYGRLPTTGRPWLAALPRPEGAARIALGLSTLLVLTTAGLAIVLVARPSSPGPTCLTAWPLGWWRPTSPCCVAPHGPSPGSR